MIEFIDNQTIKFTEQHEEDECGCVGKPFCQPVILGDETQFQLLGNILNSDPSFGDAYIGWETWQSLELDIYKTGISAEGECDGEIEATASMGSGIGYEYKIDNGSFQVSGTFTGLCEGTYLITAIDSDGHYASRYVTIKLSVDCSSLAGSDANDVISIQTNDILNCFANDLI